MNNQILCVVCTRSLEVSRKLLNSFDRQSECCNYTLHVASYRTIDAYPRARQLSFYSGAQEESRSPGGDKTADGETEAGAGPEPARAKPEYVIFINEDSELYGNDFISRIVEPLKKDPGIYFSIPSTVLAQENLSFYQMNLSCSEKKYGIALCNTITGFSADKYEIFAQANIMAVAMRYKTYLEIQNGYEFILNPIDFNLLPELTKRYPQSAVIAPQCAAYLPKFSNFTDLWKIFYNNARRNAWFNFKSDKFKIGSRWPVRSFFTLAYHCGLVREYLRNFSLFKRA